MFRRDAHPLCALTLAACQALGYAFTPDFNGPQGEGVGIYQINTAMAPLIERQGISAAGAAPPQPDLEDARACLPADASKERRAVGVQYVKHGRANEVAASKQVILCGGSINSPQLLQLSGIGNAEDLRPLGIETMVDSKAVGENLQDHLAVSYFYRSTRPTLNDQLYPLTGQDSRGDSLRAYSDRAAFDERQSGGRLRAQRRAAAGTESAALFQSGELYERRRSPHGKLLSPDPFSAFLLSFNSCRPTSRGSVKIASTDPLAAPIIRPNYLSTERDLARGASRLSPAEETGGDPSFVRCHHGRNPSGAGGRTDAELLQDFRERADTVFHPVGTCAMGPDPRRAVVDARLRVHGVANLRVIDASVFPTVTSGNTNAPTVMVAEKGAAMLLEDDHG